MEVNKQPILTFNGVDIVDVNVHIEKQVAKGNQPPIELKILPKVFFPSERPKEFIIIIDITLTGKGYFSISAVALGLFMFPDLRDEIRSQKSFININAPAIMFPYVRSFISTLTANLGANFSPIIVPPHFFQGDLQEHLEPNNVTINL
jgi:preprotein translocase subunit SecB